MKKRNTAVYVRETRRTHQCYFSWKCKDRGDIIISMGKGRTPHDIHLCEDHARNVMAQLLGYFGAGQDVQGMIETANIIMKKQNELLNRIMDNKPRSLTFNLIEELLREEGFTDEDLKGLRLKGTEEAVKMYLGYDTRDFTPDEMKTLKTEDRIKEEAEKHEEEKKDFDPGIDDDEIDAISEQLGFVIEDEKEVEDIDTLASTVIDNESIVIDEPEQAEGFVSALDEAISKAAEEEGAE